MSSQRCRNPSFVSADVVEATVRPQVVVEVFRQPAGRGVAEIENDLLGFMASGDLRPHISRRYSLEEAPGALRDMMDRKLVGKVIIEP